MQYCELKSTCSRENGGVGETEGGMSWIFKTGLLRKDLIGRFNEDVVLSVQETVKWIYNQC